MNDGEVLNTGKYRFRYLSTPHVPIVGKLGCCLRRRKARCCSSDLFHQCGDVEASTESDVIERARKTLIDYQAGPLANYMPYTKHTDGIMQRLAELKPQTIAPMHGSTYVGDGEKALKDLAYGSKGRAWVRE
jgi:hypothetical protein